MSIRRNTIGHLCALSGLLCGQDVRLGVEKQSPRFGTVYVCLLAGRFKSTLSADQKFICVHPTDLFLRTSARMER